MDPKSLFLTSQYFLHLAKHNQLVQISRQLPLSVLAPVDYQCDGSAIYGDFIKREPSVARKPQPLITPYLF